MRAVLLSHVLLKFDTASGCFGSDVSVHSYFYMCVSALLPL